MSAPLVVNTKDGTCWTRRHVTRDGLALYALEGVCQCPEFVMATLPELAEHGIVRVADVLPVPVGPEPQELNLDACVSRALRLARQYDGPDGVDQDDLDQLTDFDVPQLVAEVRAGRIELKKARAQIANHGPVLAALEQARARVAELEAERHSTNEALSDAAEQLRVDRDRIAALEAELAEYEQPADEEPIASVLTEKAEEPADKPTRTFMPVASLREVLDGEHYQSVHHDYRPGLSRDLPETGGAQ